MISANHMEDKVILICPSILAFFLDQNASSDLLKGMKDNDPYSNCMNVSYNSV